MPMFLKHKWTAVLVGTALLSPSPASAAKEPLRLKPSSKWEVNYRDDSCRLSRVFGEGDEQIFLSLDRFKPDEYLWMNIAGKSIDVRNELRPLSLRFGPSEAKQTIPIYKGKVGEELPAIFPVHSIRIVSATEEIWIPYLAGTAETRKEIEASVKQREDKVRFIAFEKPLRRSIVLETGPLRTALNALDKCTAELLTHWGIDVQKHANLKSATNPIYSSGDWIRDSDYPSKMLGNGARGIIHARLNVDEKGKPTACHIQNSNQQKEFTEIVCKLLMQRARFEPALAADGTPIASYYSQTVLFRLNLQSQIKLRQ